MSAQPARSFPALSPASGERPSRRKVQEITWAEIATRAPQMAFTMNRFLEQLAVSARPNTVDAYSLVLRFFAGRVTAADPACVRVATIERRHLEDYKRWLADRPGKKTPKLTTTTIRHNLGLLRTFFERIIDWDYDDAPAKVPIFPGDFPQVGYPALMVTDTAPFRNSHYHDESDTAATLDFERLARVTDGLTWVIADLVRVPSSVR